MNDLSRVNFVTAPRNNYVAQATIHAAIACAVIYAPLCVYLIEFGGLIERVFVAGLGGYLFWCVVWIIGAIFIKKTETHGARAITTGSVYGAIVGLASGFILASWPYCSYPTDPAPQGIVIGIGAPAMLFHAISFGRLGGENNPSLAYLSSATFWAIFGLILATLSSLRRRKRRRQLAPD